MDGNARLSGRISPGLRRPRKRAPWAGYMSAPWGYTWSVADHSPPRMMPRTAATVNGQHHENTPRTVSYHTQEGVSGCSGFMDGLVVEDAERYRRFQDTWWQGVQWPDPIDRRPWWRRALSWLRS